MKAKTAKMYFGSAALSEFLGDRPINTLQDGKFAENMTFADTLRIVWIALKEGARKAGEPFTLTFEQVCDMVDENPDLPNQAMEVFIKSASGSKEGNVKPGN